MRNIDNVVFETERLIMRPYTIEDEELVYPVVKRKEIAATTIMIPHPYPKENVVWWINFVRQNFEKDLAYEFALFDKNNSNCYIGNSALIGISKEHNKAELAYFINPDFWNRGYGTEACTRLVDFALNELELERVYGKCMSKNIASRRVMENSGLTYEGTGKHEVIKWATYEDVDHFGKIK